MPPKKVIENTLYVVDCRNKIKEKFDYLCEIYSTSYFQQKQTSGDKHRLMIMNSSKNERATFVIDWQIYKIDFLKLYKDTILLDNTEETSECKDDFLETLLTAIESFQSIPDPKNTLTNRIVIFTDLSFNMNKSPDLINKVKSRLPSVTLYIVGVEEMVMPIVKSTQDISKLFLLNYLQDSVLLNANQLDNCSTLKNISNNNIMITNYEYGFLILFAYKQNIKEPYFWYVNMTIGGDLAFPVKCCRLTQPKKYIKFHHASSSNDFAGFNPKKAWFDVNTHDLVPDSDVVSGFSYHGKFVPFTTEKYRELKPQRLQKSLKIIAFVKQEELGENLYFLPDSIIMMKSDVRKSNEKEKHFKLFIRLLREKQYAAIVTRVYNNGNRRTLFAVFPCPEHNVNTYLLMCQLPYSHQFNEKYEKGNDPVKKEETNPDLKMYTYGFLEALDGACHETEESQKDLYIPEHLMLHADSRRQYKVLKKLILDEEVDSPPKLEMDENLVEATEEFGNLIISAIKTDN